jgi:ribosomal-protein-alanine N-acetyltransferase
MMVRDIDAVLDIEVRAYSFPWTRGNFIDSLVAGYAAEVLHVIDAGRVELAGYFVAMPGVDELHLLNITVAADWQGRGLGEGLLQAVAALGTRRGLPLLFLEVRESNHRARALYRRFGFDEVGLRRGYYPAAQGREDAIVMRLPLPQAGAAG